MRTDRIVIVGGGTAGWMTATTLMKLYPQKDVVVIESSDYPTVGVGESTLGQLRRWTHIMELDENEWMSKCDASYKLSIKFTDFYDKDAGSFHYPFGRPVADGVNHYVDWAYVKMVYNEDNSDFVSSYYPANALMENNTYDPYFYGLNPDIDVAYHFDATKFGNWLRDSYCVPKGVTVLSTTVMSVMADEDGVSGLLMSDNDIVTADLYVDATGFKSILLNAVGAEWISYADLLPNNRAWATRVPYVDQEREQEPYTHSTAISNGWCWNIPLMSRLGAGYVYSDEYVSKENALEEFKQYLMSDKMVVPRTREQVDALEYRDIPMRVGRFRNSFVKNVVGIGLSAGFIEPLESNGLLSVHENLFYLADILERGKISEFDRQMYNQRFSKFFDDFATFVAMHYSLSHRDDTEYWRDIQERHYDLNGDFDSPYHTKQVAFNYLTENFMNEWIWWPNTAGMPFIGIGMGLDIINPWRAKWLEKLDGHNLSEHTKVSKESYDKRKALWDMEAKKLPSLYQWLKENRYNV